MTSLQSVQPSRPAQFGAAVALRIRTVVRASESGLIFLAVIVGIGAGLFTAGLSHAAASMHLLLYHHRSISALSQLDSPWLALVPVGGGLCLGLSGRALAHWRRRRPVDPIEANALYGGRMSVVDSLIIGAQTLLSNGFGASVGLEAGYTQLGSGFASRIGRTFNMRRSDLRMLVGAGSAGAIGAAFGAPLTGAFYAFELVIGTYTPFGLAPVIAAAISGVLVSRTIGVEGSFIGQMASDFVVHGNGILALLILSLACAAIGITIMRGVTLVEDLFRGSRLPAYVQPSVGGIGLGAMALVTPHVLSAGHGAVALLLHSPTPAIGVLVLTLLLKSTASAVSIGSGFRGGLFFASLYLGALVGTLFHALSLSLVPGLALDASTCAIVGMAGLSVTIVGGPLTMSFLALETTGDFPLSIVILAATTLVSMVVRRTFGYSFATWRLHLRGESIRSAQDIGWMRDLTVGRMMRADVGTTFADGSIGGFLNTHPLGSAHWVIATDPFDRYAGMIAVNEAHANNPDEASQRAPLSSLLQYEQATLSPDMNVREAARIFEDTESEALAVVGGDRRVLGLLTEAHVLRRYVEELDAVRKDLSGEIWIPER